MKAIKSILVILMMLFGLNVLNANQDSDIERFGRLFIDMTDDSDEIEFKDINVKEFFLKYVKPLTGEDSFRVILDKYKNNGAQYVANVAVLYAEIDYLLSLKNYLLNHTDVDKKKLDGWVSKIDAILDNKINNLSITTEASSNCADILAYIEEYLKNRGVDYYDDYAQIMVVYFTDLSSTKVKVENIFNSKSMSEILSKVSTSVIEGGEANDLKYATGNISASEAIIDIKLRSIFMNSK